MIGFENVENTLKNTFYLTQNDDDKNSTFLGFVAKYS